MQFLNFVCDTPRISQQFSTLKNAKKFLKKIWQEVWKAGTNKLLDAATWWMWCEMIIGWNDMGWNAMGWNECGVIWTWVKMNELLNDYRMKWHGVKWYGSEKKKIWDEMGVAPLHIWVLRGKLFYEVTKIIRLFIKVLVTKE